MKNIETIIKNIGIEVTAEQMTAISKEVTENYKTIAEFDKQKVKLETAQTDLSKAQEDLKNISTEFEGKTAEQWKSEVDKINSDWENEKQAREKAEKEATELAELKERFARVNEGKEWRDDLTGEAVFNQFKTSLADIANKGKGDVDILTEITKDKNYYKNPNEMPNMGDFKPNSGTVGVTKETFAKMGYVARVNLKNDNPQLYKTLTEE